MESEKSSIADAAIESVFMTLGIYPRSVTKGDVTTPRTEWQEGWNAAVGEVTNRYYHVVDFLSTHKNSNELLELIDNESMFIYFDEDEDDEYKLILTLNMNDTFMYACGDAEEFEDSDIPLISTMYNEFGHDGLTAWASMHRGCDPIDELNTQKFQEARSYLTSVL